MENYKEEVLLLRAEVARLKELVSALMAENAELRAENARLRAENAQLRKEIEYLKHGKNSRNSSMPPSADIFRSRVQNPNRIKTGKKPGGQKGHEGNNLQFQEQVDYYEQHAQAVCSGCGHSLAHVEATPGIRGQIIDIPPMKPIVTEHISMESVCPNCGTKNRGELPGTLDYCRVQYGEELRTLIVFLSVRNYMPVNRIREYIETMFGLKVSDGFIVKCIERKAEESRPTYDNLLEKIKASDVVGSDETGFKIKDKTAWMWAWKAEEHVYIVPSMKRDYGTIERVLGKENDYNFILVSDRYPAQLKTSCRAHQVCLVHLIRECTNIIEKTNSKWALKLKKILKEIIRLSKGSHIIISERDRIVCRLDGLLHQALTKSHSLVKKFCKQLLKIKDYITTCLFYADVPADNNGLERAIRNVKLKQKVSTNIRSMSGAENYAILRSIIDTAILQRKPVWDTLKNPQLLLT